MPKYYAFRDEYNWMNKGIRLNQRMPENIIQYLKEKKDISKHAIKLCTECSNKEMTSREQGFAINDSNISSIFLEIEDNIITGISSPHYNGSWVDVDIQLKESFELSDDEASDFGTDEEFSDDDYDVITYDEPKRAIAQTYQGSKNWEQIKEGSSNNNNNEQPAVVTDKGNAQGLGNFGVFTSNNAEKDNRQTYTIEQFEVDDSSVTNQKESQKGCMIM